MGKLDGPRADALRAVRAYETRKRALQGEIRREVARSIETVGKLMTEWAERAQEVDNRFKAWADRLGNDPNIAQGAKAPFIGDDFAAVLKDPETVLIAVKYLLNSDEEPFPPEPRGWSSQFATGAIEQAGLAKKEEAVEEPAPE